MDTEQWDSAFSVAGLVGVRTGQAIEVAARNPADNMRLKPSRTWGRPQRGYE